MQKADRRDKEAYAETKEDNNTLLEEGLELSESSKEPFKAFNRIYSPRRRSRVAEISQRRRSRNANVEMCCEACGEIHYVSRATAKFIEEREWTPVCQNCLRGVSQ